jgi:hypothetical protein
METFIRPAGFGGGRLIKAVDVKRELSVES